MQLLIVLVVLVGVAAVSLAQSDARARDTEGRRALAIAGALARDGRRAAGARRPGGRRGSSASPVVGVRPDLLGLDVLWWRCATAA